MSPTEASERMTYFSESAMTLYRATFFFESVEYQLREPIRTRWHMGLIDEYLQLSLGFNSYLEALSRSPLIRFEEPVLCPQIGALK